LTQRNCAAWSADTNGSSVVGIEATAAGEDGIPGVTRVCEWRDGVPGRLVDAPGQTDLVSPVSGQIAQSLKILQLEPKADA
jgi:hypothetical protein